MKAWEAEGRLTFDNHVQIAKMLENEANRNQVNNLDFLRRSHEITTASNKLQGEKDLLNIRKQQEKYAIDEQRLTDKERLAE